VPLTTEQITNLLGYDNWLMIAWDSQFNKISEALITQIQSTSFLNVPTNRFFPLRKYWNTTAINLGYPDDPTALRILWGHILYRLTEEKFPEEIRRQMKILFLSQSQDSIINKHPTGHNTVKLTANNEKYVLDVTDLL
jgi:hypothetical protein